MTFENVTEINVPAIMLATLSFHHVYKLSNIVLS